MSVNEKYEAVIGLEVHAQLLTSSKLFSGDRASYSTEPNKNISAITLAHPGTLPRLNKKVIEFAVRLGIALNCDIEPNNYFARKNYFYPDLPKGYQISQHTMPICRNGFVTITLPYGEKKVALNRIHMEEDAGKSLHDMDNNYSFIDLNRAGIPLLEIVTEPVMHSAEEAFAFVSELRRIVRYVGICDGNMEEGSLRCDANISIREAKDKRLGTKVEVKNLNSIRNVRRAIEFEIKRLIEITEKGEDVKQETRGFDAQENITFSLRSKEEADDYRYFPDPDLSPVFVSPDMIERVRNSMPKLPAELQKKYMDELHLSFYDASVICEDKDTSDYFESVIIDCKNYKAVVNWILGPIKSYQNEHNLRIADLEMSTKSLAELIDLIDEGRVSFSIASSKIFPLLVKNSSSSPFEIASQMNLLQENSASALNSWVEEVIQAMPEKVNEYRKGKKGLIALFAGEVKKISKGKADMAVVTKLLSEKLNQ